MSRTSIEWCDLSLNPGIYGCTEVSPACANCYAAGMAHRLVAMGVYPDGITEKRSSGVHWSGKVSVDFDQIEKAFAKLPKRKKARVFVTSMSDLFHADVPFEFVDEVFIKMAERPHLTFQVLTKRPERMVEFWQWVRDDACGEAYTPKWPTNVWAGCTVEDQRRADERTLWLLKVPAKVLFLSVEPMVGPVDVQAVFPHLLPSGRRLPGITWVIAGGESGSRARPSNPQWFRSLRDQCAAHDVPFFFKQNGRWVGAEDCEKAQDLGLIAHGWSEQSPEDGGRPCHEWTRDKVHAGKVYVMPDGESYWLRPGEDPKTLDGVEHQEFPRT